MKLPFATSDEFVARYRDNVTRGGIYLRAKKVLPPGTLVNLDIKLASGDRLLHGSAIVHFVTGQTGQGPSGIGLKFLSLDDKSQLFLTTLLAGQPGAFSETPPIPAGVGPVQYAEQAKTPDDTAVTRVMELPPNLNDLGAIPLPSPGGGQYASAPAAPPSMMPMDSMSIPLPSPGGSPPPMRSAAPSQPSMDAIALPSPGGAPPPSADPFNGMAGSWSIPPEQPRAASVAPVMAPVAPPSRSATQPMGQMPPAAAVSVDPALLERLELDPSSPFALLGISPGASTPDAVNAANRIRDQLQLDAPAADPLTGRLRRILVQRLEAATREVEKQTSPAPEAPEAAALRAMLQGNAAETYQFASNSSDPALASLAVAAASSIAAEHRSTEWLAQAKAAAQRAEGAPRLFGDPWALVAQAAHAIGDPNEVQAALTELAKQQPNHPFNAKPAEVVAAPAPTPALSPVTIGGDEPRKRGFGAVLVTALAMTVIGAGGGIVAAKKFPISIPGLDEAAVVQAKVEAPVPPKAAEAKKAEQAGTETKVADAKVAETKAAETKVAEDAKAADVKTADAAKATAEKAAADAKAESDAKAAELAAAEAKAAAEKTAADKAAADQALAEKVAAEKTAADKAVADKAAADAKALADAKAAEDAKKAELAAAEAEKADAAKGETKVASATYDAAKDDQLLSRSERAIDNGANCAPYLAGLAEVFANNPSPARKGKALIMRARCYDSMGKSGSAKSEYKKYVLWFPKGSYAEEARDAQ